MTTTNATPTPRPNAAERANGPYTTPATPAMTADPIAAGAKCRQCAFYVMVDPREAAGECRRGPPRVAAIARPGPRPTAMPAARYPGLPPGTPACSEFLAPDEWRAFRARFLAVAAEAPAR
jgi:hypothetical protein